MNNGKVMISADQIETLVKIDEKHKEAFYDVQSTNLNNGNTIAVTVGESSYLIGKDGITNELW